jgi:hypothetical protein
MQCVARLCDSPKMNYRVALRIVDAARRCGVRHRAPLARVRKSIVAGRQKFPTNFTGSGRQFSTSIHDSARIHAVVFQ